MTTTSTAQKKLEEELEEIRDNVYSYQTEMGIGALLSAYNDGELVIRPNEQGSAKPAHPRRCGENYPPQRAGFCWTDFKTKDTHHRKPAE